MMIQAVLSNPKHPEYGVATIPFPIPHDQYAHCMELLEALEIGDAVKTDCKVEKVDSFYTVLKRVEMLTVNVEELNYLAKRLDSFDTGEVAQFQAMAHITGSSGKSGTIVMPLAAAVGSTARMLSYLPALRGGALIVPQDGRSYGIHPLVQCHQGMHLSRQFHGRDV